MAQGHRKGRPPERNRAEIVQSARTVAVERGFEGLRFIDVSQSTGVPVSSLQYTFGTRDALVREVLRSGVHDELNRLVAAVGREPDPWLRIEQFIRMSISADDVHRREGWLLWIEYWRAALRDPELRADYVTVARTWRGLVQRAVDDGLESGAFSIEGTSEDAAAAIVALVDGLGLQVEVGDNRMRATRAVRTATRSAARVLGVSAR